MDKSPRAEFKSEFALLIRQFYTTAPPAGSIKPKPAPSEIDQLADMLAGAAMSILSAGRK